MIPGKYLSFAVERKCDSNYLMDFSVLAAQVRLRGQVRRTMKHRRRETSTTAGVVDHSFASRVQVIELQYHPLDSRFHRAFVIVVIMTW
jgi:hypothetical protein